MATWNQTLEPYVKVHERIKTATLNPTAGESLIIGAVFISDAGPSTPTLITSQKEFLETYASKDLTKEYVESLNQLYTGDDKTLAATMWANAYRLAGSNTLLMVRASKADNIFFSLPLQKGDALSKYILRDGELMKRVDPFKIVIDNSGDTADHNTDGWSIAVNGVGIFGNRNDDNGAQYDYFVQDLPELVEKLNETSKFFSPNYTFYYDADTTDGVNNYGKCIHDKPYTIVNPETGESVTYDKIVTVKFDEAYLGVDILDKTDERCPDGLYYLVTALPDWTADDQKTIDLNDTSWSGFTPADYYATNVFNSATNLKVRIRRFNHDAVVSKEIAAASDLNKNSESPYVVLEDVLSTFTKGWTEEPSEAVLERDFYEVAVLDPSINSEVSYFNLGNIAGRGDMELSELNSLLKMIQLSLPDDLHDLGLNYWGDAKSGRSDEAIFADLTIDPTDSAMLSVSDADLKKALDKIVLDEVYVTEGLCDLGNTELSFQSYMANVAINDNYFYPISTVNSTNYMTIGNAATKISQDSCKLYMNAPWDIDSATTGYKFYASPAVLYWEAVARNRRNNREFASVFGQTTGVAQYARPTVEFNKRQRELLLTRKVNTVLWSTSVQQYQFNDCVTKQSENNILSEDGNSRLTIRISKAMPTLLRQFIGKKISEKLCADVVAVIEYWFKTVILPMEYSVDQYMVFCNFDEALARQNKIKVVVNVRYQRSLKIIEAYNQAYDVGMDISNPDA
jgi:hypothetical protein